ncbi:MAG: hypothetical protein IKB31_03655 [Bacteroidaceae bacterium]|nr:hypothetical protein [Bacteroidaceae bacterium]
MDTGKRDDFYEGVRGVRGVREVKGDKGVRGVKANSFDYENINKSMG